MCIRSIVLWRVQQSVVTDLNLHIHSHTRTHAVHIHWMYKHSPTHTIESFLWGEVESGSHSVGHKQPIRPLWHDGWRATSITCAVPALYQPSPLPPPTGEPTARLVVRENKLQGSVRTQRSKCKGFLEAAFAPYLPWILYLLLWFLDNQTITKSTLKIEN